MRESAPIGNLAAAVSDALRGEPPTLRGVVAAARQRAEGRVLDALGPRVEAGSAPPLLASARARTMPHPGPDREVVIRLRDGRRLRAMISPAIARRRDLSAVARASAENNRRAFAALGGHHSAIQRLARSQQELAGKVAAMQEQTDRAVIGLVEGLAGLQRTVGQNTTQTIAALTPPSGRASDVSPLGEVRPVRQRPETPRLRGVAKMRPVASANVVAVRAQIQNVTNIVNSLQAVAYGQKGRLLAPNNLILAGNQLFWSLVDPVLQGVGVLNAASATVVAAVAPLGNLLTGQILLADRQTVRFISGVGTLNSANETVVVSLRDQVGERLWPTFRQRTDVPVTVTVFGDTLGFARLGIVAEIDQGDVRIRLRGVPRTLTDVPFSTPLRVAWIVDTGADVG